MKNVMKIKRISKAYKTTAVNTITSNYEFLRNMSTAAKKDVRMGSETVSELRRVTPKANGISSS